MKKMMLLVSLTLISSVAVAGKAERDKKQEVETALAESAAGFEKACGCPLKFEVKWDQFTTVDGLGQIKYMANNIKNSAAGHCTDADSKKAMCAMTAITVEQGAEPKVTFAGGTATVTHTQSMYSNWNMIVREVDK